MSGNVNGFKSRRYSFEERRQILEFIDRFNAERGRGGRSAAAKHFKIMPMTITKWRSSMHAARPGSIDKKLSQLQELHDKIAELERSLRHWRTQYDSLKELI